MARSYKASMRKKHIEARDLEPSVKPTEQQEREYRMIFGSPEQLKEYRRALHNEVVGPGIREQYPEKYCNTDLTPEKLEAFLEKLANPKEIKGNRMVVHSGCLHRGIVDILKDGTCNDKLCPTCNQFNEALKNG